MGCSSLRPISSPYEAVKKDTNRYRNGITESTTIPAKKDLALKSEIVKELITQLVALGAFFTFPAIQYILLKRFARNEGKPELWYLPRYGFRLVIRNIPGKKTLTDLRYCARLRKIVPSSEGSSVFSYEDDILIREHDFFLFPGSDQLILSFRVEGEDERNLEFLLTDKFGNEKRRVPFRRMFLFAIRVVLEPPREVHAALTDVFPADPGFFLLLICINTSRPNAFKALKRRCTEKPSNR